MASSQLWIAIPSMFMRGWGFKAVPCEHDDPDRACPMAGDDTRWIKPEIPMMFQAWLVAGKPQDPESLRFYGAMPCSEGQQ